MKLTSSGVVVYIPRWLDKNDPQVQAFIESGLKQLEGQWPPAPRTQQSSVEELLAMVDAWAAKIGAQPKRVRMRTMRSRWGSCSSRGNINLNRALCSVPPRLAEYVVCHELIHLRIFNHSQAFKALMTQYMPDWKEREQELRGYRP